MLGFLCSKEFSLPPNMVTQSIFILMYKVAPKGVTCNGHQRFSENHQVLERNHVVFQYLKLGYTPVWNPAKTVNPSLPAKASGITQGCSTVLDAVCKLRYSHLDNELHI